MWPVFQMGEQERPRALPGLCSRLLWLQEQIEGTDQGQEQVRDGRAHLIQPGAEYAQGLCRVRGLLVEKGQVPDFFPRRHSAL